jgi:Predicted transcriptional regulator with C-terminal CBS domains
MTPSSTLLRQARSLRHQTQRAVAARAGIAQPTIAAIESGRRDATVSTISRLVEATGCQLAVLPTRAPAAAAAAAAIEQALRAADEPSAFRHVIQLADDLDGAEPALAVALCVQPPAPTGSDRYDALLAALVEHRLRGRRLPVPIWVREPQRTLPRPTPLLDADWYRELSDATAPPAFRTHNILIPAGELESV